MHHKVSVRRTMYYLFRRRLQILLLLQYKTSDLLAGEIASLFFPRVLRHFLSLGRVSYTVPYKTLLFWESKVILRRGLGPLLSSCRFLEVHDAFTFLVPRIMASTSLRASSSLTLAAASSASAFSRAPAYRCCSETAR